MKTIGLIGGMSWESTLEYYRILNEAVKERLGGLHSAKCIIYSVDFEEIEKLQHQGRWNEAEQILVHAAQGLEKAGADFLLIGTNTMHKLFENIQEQSSIPIFHIADATALSIKEMEMRMIRNALEECNWVIDGKRGAAFRLDMAPSTLRERMKKYGLKRPSE